MQKVLTENLWMGFRSLFCLVSNKELEKNPDVISLATPWFVFFVFLEFIVGRYRGYQNYRINDTIISLLLGSLSEQAKLWSRTVLFLIYPKVYEKIGIRIFDDNDSFVAFLFAMFMVDFFYYWFHRFCHEFHFSFATHSVHHSGEDFNLATALRQGSYQSLISIFFTLPLAIIIPPPAIFGHFFMNTTSQFWFHTSQIGDLGLIEYILNTPSAHRVHHAPPGNCNVST